MLRQLCMTFFACLFVTLLSQMANAQAVAFSFEELSLDGSNIDTSGVQVIGHNASSNDISAAGVNWLLNGTQVLYNGMPDISAISGIGDRNNPGGGETFVAGSFATQDRYFDPLGTGTETALHDAMESILFGGSFTVEVTGLVENTDYRVQIVSWDAAVEGEGDGAVNTTKEYRYSELSAGTDSIIYNQFVVDGTDDFLTMADGLYGNSSDEITGALITALFTTGAGQTSLEFAFSLPAESSPGVANNNDNAIINAIAVHNLSIPEPTSLALMAMSLFGLGVVRRRG